MSLLNFCVVFGGVRIKLVYLLGFYKWSTQILLLLEFVRNLIVPTCFLFQIFFIIKN